MTVPKIELHVHLEGTIRPGTLLGIARRNALPLPVDTEEELARLYRYRDFTQFLSVWAMTTKVLQREADFRQVVVDYAHEAAAHGAVYVEGIFTPAEPVRRGTAWDEVFTGYCDGAQQAREETGVEVRLTPDIPRGYPVEYGELTARHALRYRDRGVVGLGLGGSEEFPPELFEHAFAVGRDGGLGRSRTPASGRAPARCGVRWRRSAPTGSGMECERSRMAPWCRSSPAGAWSSTCA